MVNRTLINKLLFWWFHRMYRFVLDLFDTFAEQQKIQDNAQQQLINGLQDQVDALTLTTATVAASVAPPIITNFLQDADINTSDLVRRAFGYSGSDNHPAFWYARDASLTTQFTDSTNTTVSPEAIPLVQLSGGASVATGATTLVTAAPFFTAAMVGQSVFIPGAAAAGADLTTVIDAFTDNKHVTIHDAATIGVAGVTIAVFPVADTLWNKSAGSIMWGGNNRVAQPLNKNWARPGVGTSIFIRAILKYNSDFNVPKIDPTYQMRISILDNTPGQQKTIEGADFDLNVESVSGAGLVTRNYVLKVNTPAPAPNNFFYSSVSAPASITNTPDPTSGTPGQYSISWQSFPPVVAESYELYRSDSVRGLGNYYRIAHEAGLTEIQDIGGLGDLGPITITANPMKAQAVILGIGDKITTSGWNELNAHILVPPTYALSNTADNSQWIIFDILDSTGALVSIASKSILIDRVSASYSDGAWQPSVYDMTAPGDFQGTTPDPNGGSPSGPTGGGSGGGGGKILPNEMAGF